MSTNPKKLLTRRAMLGRCALLSLPAISIPLILHSRASHAGTVPKSDFHYQEYPNVDKRCAQCTAFVPGSGGDSPGTCKVVAGPISPNGWCMAYSARQ